MPCRKHNPTFLILEEFKEIAIVDFHFETCVCSHVDEPTAKIVITRLQFPQEAKNTVDGHLSQ